MLVTKLLAAAAAHQHPALAEEGENHPESLDWRVEREKQRANIILTTTMWDITQKTCYVVDFNVVISVSVSSVSKHFQECLLLKFQVSSVTKNILLKLILRICKGYIT